MERGDDGEIVIIALVHGLTDEVRAKFPKDCDGVRIVAEECEPSRALDYRSKALAAMLLEAMKTPESPGSSDQEDPEVVAALQEFYRTSGQADPADKKG